METLQELKAQSKALNAALRLIDMQILVLGRNLWRDVLIDSREPLTKLKQRIDNQINKLEAEVEQC